MFYNRRGRLKVENCSSDIRGLFVHWKQGYNPGFGVNQLPGDEKKGKSKSVPQQVVQYVNICSEERAYQYINNLQRHMTSPMKGRAVNKRLKDTHKQLKDVSLFIYDYTHE